ncbi:MAG: NYN domain-containing protein [Planctomycetota bacterium]
MKSVAVLIDLGFLLYKMYPLLGRRHATAEDIVGLAKRCVTDQEEVFRVFCYHCPPYDNTQRNPVSGEKIDFKSQTTYRRMSRLIDELERTETIAFRKGEISFDGWKIGEREAGNLAKNPRPVQAGDFRPDFKQKQVDIKIGLDVAWLSSKRIVDRIALVTSDNDFIPAMKFARREGVQVILVGVGDHHPPKSLQVHADYVRRIQSM